MSRKKSDKKMKKFESFMAAPAPVKPNVLPGTKPGVRPGRPSPIKRDKPGVNPAPKAQIEDVVNRFVDELLIQPAEKQQEILDAINANNPAPSQPTVLPGTKPGVRPGRPSPIKRDKPGVNPAPKAYMESHIMKWKTFEASLEDNPAIPPNLLGDIEGAAQQQISDRGIPRNPQVEGMELVQLSQEAMQLQRPHKEALETIVYDAVMDMYGNLIDNVVLDVKLVEPGEANEMMEEPEEEDLPTFDEIEDEDLKRKIHARKVANALIQGESKNVFRIIELPEFKEAIEALNPRLYVIYKRIAEINELFHWNIPMEVQAQMWKQHPEGQAGAEKVEYNEEESDDTEKTIEELLASNDDDEGGEEPTERIVGTIYAVGIDVPVLIHEAVKGILEMIAAHTIPDDEESAKIMMMNTSGPDNEIEDLRYGPGIAAKLRDVVNEVQDADYDPNIRFHVWGKMMQMDAEAFLDLMYRILSSDPSGKDELTTMVRDIVSSLKDYDSKAALGEFDEGPEQTPDLGITPPVKQTPAADIAPPKKELPLRAMNARELENEINKAIDSGDFGKAQEISDILKERDAR